MVEDRDITDFLARARAPRLPEKNLAQISVNNVKSHSHTRPAGEQGSGRVNARPGLRFPHGRQGTRLLPESVAILRTCRDLIALGRSDRDRRDQALMCLRIINRNYPGGLDRRYDVAVLRRYIDLLGARIIAAAPRRLPRTGRGLSLDIYKAASDLALTLLPVAAGDGAVRR